MDTVLGVHVDQQVHMVRHNFEGKEFGSKISTDLLYNLLETNIDTLNEYRPTILRTPNNVVFTRVDDIII